MWERIKGIVRKEFIQTLRDPRMRALLLGPPLLQLLIFGYAVNLDVENARTAWMDMDHTPQSRELFHRLEGSRYFRIVAMPGSEEEVRTLMDRGDLDLVIRVLPGFGREILRGSPSAVQILVNGTNSNTASIVSSYAVQNITALSAGIVADRARAQMGSGPTFVPVITEQFRVWFNPDLKSRVFFVPGVVVNIIALVTIMLTAMSIVREKEIGTMEQLMVSPVRPFELVVGKLIPFAIVGVFEVALVVLAALAIFSVPLRGSILLLLGCSLLFLLSTLGMGLFISTISQTQQQAMMASFFFFMPALLLSGFAFPIRNMPPVVRILTYLNPLRYFMEIVRGLFLKGTGVSALWQEMVALAVFGSLILGLSTLRFRKRLD